MSTLSHAASSAEKRTNARYWIVVMLFIVTSFNYGDRATLSIAGSEMAKDIGLDPVGMGYVFAAIAGIMVAISLDELIPAAREYGEPHKAMYGMAAGMVVMGIGLVFLQ